MRCTFIVYWTQVNVVWGEVVLEEISEVVDLIVADISGSVEGGVIQ